MRPSRLLPLAGWLLLAGCESDLPDATPRPGVYDPDVLPGPGSLPRLTRSQYRHAIIDLLGPAIVVPAALEPDIPIEGSVALGTTTLAVSARGVGLYERAAYAIAEQAMAEGPARDALVTCAPTGPGDAACAGEVLAPLARRAYRRTPSPEELEALVAVAVNAGATLGDFHDGLEYGIAAILMTPDFLYRPALGGAAPEGGALSQLELASRLAFFLWDTLPDDALLDHAEAGTLEGAGLEAEVDRMLADPRLAQGLRAFATDWLELDRLSNLSKDSTMFRAASAELGPDAREETLRFLEHHFLTEEVPYRDIFTSRTTFVNRRLASIYGVEAPAREGFGAVTLPEDGERIGLLGHASLLSLHAHATSTSPTLRGKFIRTTLLCTEIPPPPASVETTIPPPSVDATTLRDRLAAHRDSPACAACHTALDPIGLGLEQFDGIGALRTLDNGAPIDASGHLDDRPFTTGRQLAELVAEHPELVSCFVERVFRYATGSEPEGDDEGALHDANQRFVGGGTRYRALVRAIALSPSFRAVRAPHAEAR